MQRATTTKTKRNNLKKRLAAYSVAAAALAAGSGDRTASAGTIIFDIPDLTVGPVGVMGSAGIYVDVDGGAAAPISLGTGTDLLLKAYNGTASRYGFGLVLGSFLVESLAVGTIFGGTFGLPYMLVNIPPGPFPPATLPPGQNFLSFFGLLQSSAATFTAPLGNFPPGTRGNIGFTFEIGTDVHAGFAQVTWDFDSMDNLLSLTLHSFGYNDVAGDPVNVPAVPEPSSLGLLALGAAGLTGWRRRKRAG